MKKLLSMLFLLLLVCGCSDKKTNSLVPNSIINDSILEDILEEDNYIIVDVRTKAEYEDGHLVGAINIPHVEIDENIDLDKNKHILVYCKSGGRSSVAKKVLEDLGYTVYDLGGFDSIDLPKE